MLWNTFLLELSDYNLMNPISLKRSFRDIIYTVHQYYTSMGRYPISQDWFHTQKEYYITIAMKNNDRRCQCIKFYFKDLNQFCAMKFEKKRIFIEISEIGYPEIQNKFIGTSSRGVSFRLKMKCYREYQFSCPFSKI